MNDRRKKFMNRCAHETEGILLLYLFLLVLYKPHKRFYLSTFLHLNDKFLRICTRDY